MNQTAFLNAILAEPDDLTHRLVYADWLSDRDAPGDAERAEFIRTQIRRESLHPSDPETRVLLNREGQLLKQYETHWVQDISLFVQRYRFHRGFIEEVTLGIEQLLSRGQDLFSRSPIRRMRIRRLMHLPELLRRNPKYARLLSDLLSRVRSLDLSRDFLSEPVGQELLNLPRLPQPEELNLEFNTLSPAAVSVLASSEVLAQVRRLAFNSTVDPAVSVATLLDSPHLGNLQSLHLTGNRQGDVVVSVLLGSPVLSHLHSLSLSHTNLTPDGLANLVTSDQVSSLASLDVGFNALGIEGARHLVQSSSLPSLEILNLSWARLADPGTILLSQSHLFGRLRGIDLSFNEITRTAGLTLADYPYATQLGTLDLIYNSLTETARQSLQDRFGQDVCLFDR